jgi:hypothetical protein
MAACNRRDRLCPNRCSLGLDHLRGPCGRRAFGGRNRQVLESEPEKAALEDELEILAGGGQDAGRQ